MKSEELCVAKLELVSSSHCKVHLAFNGAMKVVVEDIKLEEVAHIETETFYDGDLEVVTSHQVGQAGAQPFVDELKERYPNVLIIPEDQFDTIAELQKAQASSMVM